MNPEVGIEENVKGPLCVIDIEVDRGTGALSAASLIAVGPGAAVVPLVARVVE